MKVSQWALPFGTLLLGLVLGGLWNSKSNHPSVDKLAQAHFRHPLKSTPQASGSLSSSNQYPTQKQAQIREGSDEQELTSENLLSIFGSFWNQDEMNPMAFSRYSAQLAQMGELQSIDLLKKLQGPINGEDQEKARVASFASQFVFARLCELNGPEAMRMLSSGELGDTLPDEVAGIGMNAWVAADPEGARRWFETAMVEYDDAILAREGGVAPKGTALLILESDITRAYLRGMAAKNPEAIGKSIASFQRRSIREDLQIELADYLIEKVETKDEVLALLNSEIFNDYPYAYDGFADKLARMDFDAARRWAETQPVSLKRDLMNFNIAATLSKEDPQRAASWYLAQELSPESDAKRSRLSNYEDTWAVQDLEGAANWLLEQPNNSPTRSIRAEFSPHQHPPAPVDWEAAFRWSSDDSPTIQQTNKPPSIELLRSAWDSRYNTRLNPEAEKAARAAGLGQAVDDYIKSKTLHNDS